MCNMIILPLDLKHVFCVSNYGNILTLNNNEIILEFNQIYDKGNSYLGFYYLYFLT